MIAEYIKLQILDLIRWGLGTMMASTLLIAIFLMLWIMSRVIDVRRIFGSG
jgi:putative spermidine/putrescine transport system permease protein